MCLGTALDRRTAVAPTLRGVVQTAAGLAQSAAAMRDKNLGCSQVHGCQHRPPYAAGAGGPTITQ